MWEQINKNRRNSIFIILLMFLLVPILGYCIGIIIFCYLDMAYSIKLSCIPFLSVVVTSLFFLYVVFFYRNSRLLGNFDSYEIAGPEHYVLNNVVEEMTIAAGFSKKPKIYIIDSPVPNAFATGFKPSMSAIAVTTGLLTELDRNELQGVIAHEIAHIVNRDTMYMMYSGFILLTISKISDIMYPYKRNRFSCKKNDVACDIVRILIWCICKVLSEMVYPIFYFSLSREREYLADACAVKFTRYPEGLSSALHKISNYNGWGSFDTDKLTSAMCIVNPSEFLKNSISFFNNLFLTHPPTEKRIQILMSMSGIDYNAYNKAYMDALKTKKGLFTRNINKQNKKSNIIKNTCMVNKLSLDNNYLSIAAESYKINKTDKKAVNSKTTFAQEKNAFDETLNNNYENSISYRKRQACDIVLKKNKYIFIECSCETKLKFPSVYEGKEIICPHCKKIIRVVYSSDD